MPRIISVRLHLRSLLLPCLFFIVGTALTIMPYFGWNFSTIPGEGDTRFNGYILEHGYQWLTGHEKTFWDAPFFYPAPSVIGLSDNHLGNLPFYAVFRGIGMNPDHALQGWIILQFILNFFVCTWVLRRLGFSGLAATLGSYLFTFGMPLIGQIGHIQLLPRFLVPLTFYLSYRYLRRPSSGTLFVGFAALCGQFLLSIYLGVLLTLAILIMIAAIVLFRFRRLDWKAIVFPGVKPVLFRILPMLCLAAIVFDLLLPHFEVWQWFRDFKPLSMSFLIFPQWRSYLLPCPDVPCWQWLYRLIQIDFCQGEHIMFIGAAAVFAVVMAGVGCCRRTTSFWLKVCLFSWLILLLITLNVNGNSIFHILRQTIPGLTSIRNVTRISLITLFFAAVALAWTVDFLLHRRQCRTAGRLWLGLLVVILIGENAVWSTSNRYDPKVANLRVERIKTAILKLPPQSVFIYLPPSPPSYTNMNLDAMWASLETGIPTINGYSGHNPPGWFMWGFADHDNQQQLTAWITFSGQFFFMSDPQSPWQRPVFFIRDLDSPLPSLSKANSLQSAHPAPADRE